MFVPWIVFFGAPFFVVGFRKFNAAFIAPWAEKKRKKNVRLANLEDWDTVKVCPDAPGIVRRTSPTGPMRYICEIYNC